MTISYNWLKDYLECDLTPEEIAAALTSIGLEVDSLETQEEIPGGLAGVIVADQDGCGSKVYIVMAGVPVRFQLKLLART